MLHTHSLRVYWEDTDAGGIVYYANYLKFAERARSEMLRAAGVDQTALLREYGVAVVVRRCEADFLAPARLDDLLTVQTQLQDIGKVRMTMRQAIRKVPSSRDARNAGADPARPLGGPQDDAVLARLLVTLACVDGALKPARWPEAVTRALK